MRPATTGRMDDRVLDRLRDRLPVNPPYEGLVAIAYDSWIGVDDVFPDDHVYEAILAEVTGPVLELGCGTGRPLLRWLAAGHDVEGVDGSADMLSILRAHAEQRQVDPVVHHGDIAPLDLGRSYTAIVCPAGTFTLIVDEDRIESAVKSYWRHLEPGGTLALSLAALEPTGDESLRWRVRRTGTLGDGTTIVVHEAEHLGSKSRHLTAYNRIETFDPAGSLTGTLLRRVQLRSWERGEAERLLSSLGFVEVRSRGSDRAWVTIGRRPT